jgi:predicted nucleic acid-binding Zn ribbon protein
MKRYRAKAKSIENIVKDVIRSLSGKNRISEEEVGGAWEDTAGREAARHTKPVSVKKSVLTVNVDSSSWLYELTTKKRDLLKRLEGKLRGKKLKEIRFRIGGIK